MGADPAEIQLKVNVIEEQAFLLCFIDIYSKFLWVAPIKDKNGIAITNVF